MFKGQNGSALITGMIAALSVGIVSAVILQQSQVTDKQTRIPRVKSSMLMVETQLNEALNQSVIVKPCASKVPDCLEINDEALDKMAVAIPGAVCSKPSCGISIQNRNLSGNQFTARIVYDGTEVSVAPVNVTLSIQENEAWATANSSCPDTQPLLVGFNPDGSRICRSLPANCGPGMYVSNIDPMSLTSGGVTCTNFPANVACLPNQIMVGFRWTGGSTGFTPQCADFLNPFDPKVLNDPTNYAYAPPITPVLTGWPTTTTIAPTTTSTTLIATTTTTIVTPPLAGCENRTGNAVAGNGGCATLRSFPSCSSANAGQRLYNSYSPSPLCDSSGGSVSRYVCNGSSWILVNSATSISICVTGIGAFCFPAAFSPSDSIWTQLANQGASDVHGLGSFSTLECPVPSGTLVRYDMRPAGVGCSISTHYNHTSPLEGQVCSPLGSGAIDSAGWGNSCAGSNGCAPCELLLRCQ